MNDWNEEKALLEQRVSALAEEVHDLELLNRIGITIASDLDLERVVFGQEPSEHGFWRDIQPDRRNLKARVQCNDRADSLDEIDVCSPSYADGIEIQDGEMDVGGRVVVMRGRYSAQVIERGRETRGDGAGQASDQRDVLRRRRPSWRETVDGPPDDRPSQSRTPYGTAAVKQ